jgi:hypothetical protein
MKFYLVPSEIILVKVHQSEFHEDIYVVSNGPNNVVKIIPILGFRDFSLLILILGSWRCVDVDIVDVSEAHAASIFNIEVG